MTLWRLSLPVSPASADLFEMALEPHCDVVSRYLSDDGCWRLEGHATAEPDVGLITQALASLAAEAGLEVAELVVESIDPRDWVGENLNSFAPIRAGRYFVHGSHRRETPPPGCIAIEVDAGAAFGSGEHATTRGCLLALDGLAQRRFRRPLDMGCGSGILALAMAATWKVPVMAVDIDSVAVEVTRANARLNRAATLIKTAVGGGYAGRSVRRGRPYDLIVSNILANPLCRMARDLDRSLGPKGMVLLSGFVERDAQRVFETHRRFGLKLYRRIVIDGWVTLVITR